MLPEPRREERSVEWRRRKCKRREDGADADRRSERQRPAKQEYEAREGERVGGMLRGERVAKGREALPPPARVAAIMLNESWQHQYRQIYADSSPRTGKMGAGGLAGVGAARLLWRAAPGAPHPLTGDTAPQRATRSSRRIFSGRRERKTERRTEGMVKGGMGGKLVCI